MKEIKSAFIIRICVFKSLIINDADVNNYFKYYYIYV